MASSPNSQHRGRSPCVSVIIPIYNGAATIDRALKSVFDQTFTDYEIVVCDDGSTDDTPSVLAKYGDKLRVVRQPNRGLPAARNAAVAASRGELLALIDHDDEWLPQKLELAVAAMRSDPGAALLYSDMIVVNEAGEEFRRSQIGPETAHAPTMDEMLARIWPITPSTVVMRRDAFDRAGGFCEQLISAEDIHFWLLMREQGHFIFLPDRLVRFTYGQLFPKVLNRDIGPDAIVDLIRCPLRCARRRVGEEFHPPSRANDRERRRGRDESREHGRRASMFHPRAEIRSAPCEELHANCTDVPACSDPPRARRESIARS